jgi:hypothetical protein
MTQTHMTVQHLESMPVKEGYRYELITRELFLTTQPHLNHQILTAHFINELG